MVDGDGSIHPDINAAYKTEQTFINKDKEVQARYVKARAKTSKLKGAYPTYQCIIGKQARDSMTLSMEGKSKQIQCVSDPRISFSRTVSALGNTK